MISVEDCVELARVVIDSYVGNKEGNLLRGRRVTARYREIKYPNDVKTRKRNNCYLTG